MVASIIGTSLANAQAFSRQPSPAARLGPPERVDLAVQALAGSEPVARLAGRHNVSRKFVYQQKAKAAESLDQAFSPSLPDHEVLFQLPVTKDWLRQFVLAQTLIGHTSFRGVTEILDAVFDYRDYPGTPYGFSLSLRAITRGHIIRLSGDTIWFFLVLAWSAGLAGQQTPAEVFVQTPHERLVAQGAPGMLVIPHHVREGLLTPIAPLRHVVRPVRNHCSCQSRHGRLSTAPPASPQAKTVWCPRIAPVNQEMWYLSRFSALHLPSKTTRRHPFP